MFIENIRQSILIMIAKIYSYVLTKFIVRLMAQAKPSLFDMNQVILQEKYHWRRSLTETILRKATLG